MSSTGNSPSNWVWLCSLLYRHRYGTKLRPAALRFVCGREGGQLRSPTLRRFLQTYHRVEVGMYSYGPALWPGGLPEGTRIGNYCSIAPGLQIFRRNHPTERISLHPFFYNASLGLMPSDSITSNRDNPLIVGDDVWIGANVIITPTCRLIGTGAVIGAGAVVTKDVAPFAIAAGAPARELRQRFPPEIQRAILDSRWWEYPIERLVPVMNLFTTCASLAQIEQLLIHLRTGASVHSIKPSEFRQC